MPPVDEGFHTFYSYSNKLFREFFRLARPRSRRVVTRSLHPALPRSLQLAMQSLVLIPRFVQIACANALIVIADTKNLNRLSLKR